MRDPRRRGARQGGVGWGGAIVAALFVAAVFAPALLVAVPATAAESVDLGAYGVPLRFEAPPGVTLEVADVGRYVGTVEGRLTADGRLRIVNELPMEAYVEGVAEVPARWPLEALKAQAVAARTYAWYQVRLDSFDGYDICPTVACQVFKGREVVEAPGVGERWREAVAATRGEVLLHRGEPILARYFSTSGGHTVSNEEVFDEGPRPYLVGVPDPDDAVSPLHRWEVTFTREELNAILSRGRTLAAAVPLADVELVVVAGGPDRVRVTGRDGRRVSVTAPAFRGFVSDVAPDLFPDRFPSLRRDGQRRLPTTLPSSRLEFTLTPTQVVVSGRGWGHGVGMGQWGAMGKAAGGMGYGDILAAYYGGLRPAVADALPPTIRVGLSATDRMQVTADGPFRVVAGATAITARGLGTWTVQRRPDRTLGLAAPAGYGAPLVVSPTTTARPDPTAIEVIELETVVNKAVELTLEVVAADRAEVIDRRPLGIAEAGRHAVAWSLDRTAGGALPPGDYRVRLLATDEDGVSAGEPVAVTVRELVATAPPGSLLGPVPGAAPVPGPPLLLVGLLGVALGAAAGVAVPVRPA